MGHSNEYEALAERFEAFVVDYDEGEGMVVLRGGRAAVFPIVSPPVEEIRIRKTCYMIAERLLWMVLPGGGVVSAEAGFGLVDQPLMGRPVIYLDQCHWSAIANAVYGGRISERVKEAALRILSLANSGKIVLPLSSAHMIETSATYAEKRQNLATVMLGASRGWIMRDPIDVRQDEALSALTRRYLSTEREVEPVFCLDHSRLYAGRSAAWHPEGPHNDLPPLLTEVWIWLTEVSSTYDTLVDPQSIDDRVHYSKWAVYHQRLSSEFAAKRESSARKRKLGLLAAFSDVHREIAKMAAVANLSVEQFRDWVIVHRESDIARLPFLGLYFDTMALRLSDSSRKWQANDLIDGLYLSCATAYADAVGGERAATEYIRRSWRNRDGQAPIFATLAELVEYVDGELLRR
ncbi:hypothetical protein [Actinosynnema sp. NPDC020468]|uniref:hypothetical protein n=1 Tax=Actinosynnema sp. NPDC020468 TaxID=3154488 RepID=UPI0034115CDC